MIFRARGEGKGREMAAISWARALTRYRNIIGEWSKGSRGKEKWNVEKEASEWKKENTEVPGVARGKEKGRGGVAVKGGNRIRSEERKPLANPLNAVCSTLIFRNPTRDLLRDGEGATDFQKSSLPLLDRVNIAKFSFQRFCSSPQSCYPAKLCKIILLEIFSHKILVRKYIPKGILGINKKKE